MNVNENCLGSPDDPQIVASGNRVEASLVGHVGPARLVFACSHCDREFTTKTGLGVHVSRAHVALANEAIRVDRAKRRWTDEEKLLLAKIEAQVILGGTRRVDINGHLVTAHPGRTFDAIKSRRKTEDHKALVLEAVQRGKDNNRIVPNAETVADPASPMIAETVDVEPNDENRGTVIADDRANTISRPDMSLDASRRAVEWLTAVSGHGAQKLLYAAKLLVE